ncbi:ATP-dependent DNA/RNA helicase [Spiromyces aspiralis]|uniref:ATP-dependent DNA/RNA helicase n=1 Tax=Spiromyces aspiralis TaxID=68401 RepID=A0ACC1HNP6_9FUNG|nr:ATP-dependent DNA/RNA helicase [Spiromyces aspiralis]
MEANLLDKEQTFETLDLDDRLLRALGVMGLVHPTLVQAKAVPLALSGKDILARARTGSGKTAAYCLPVIQQILRTKQGVPLTDPKRNATRALILVPTKELAEQVAKYIKDLTQFCAKELSVVNIANNAPLHMQKPILAERHDIVVSTPARILQHLSAGSLELRESLSMLVVDEADLVLSFGYEEDLQKTITYLPKVYQTLLMSATLTKDVQELKRLMLRNPAILKLEEDGDDSARSLTQYAVHCSETEKFLLIYVILKLRLIAGKCIIFVNDIDRCYRLKLYLEQFSIRSCVLNSELPLNSRHHIVEEFNRGVYDYIIATDEGQMKGEADSDSEDDVDGGDDSSDREKAKHQQQEGERGKGKKRKRAQDKEYGVTRGIDFKGTAAVINFDFPKSARSYTHRIGRTARGGRKGMSLSFVVPADSKERLKWGSTKNDDERIYAKVVEKQKAKGAEIHPYKFDMKQVNGFRYRAEDAMRAVTKAAVQEARIKEVKQEILNSEKLRAHFEDRPADLQFLRHDKALHPSRVQPHMKHIPDYLVPRITGVAKADGVADSVNRDFIPFHKPGQRRKGSKYRQRPHKKAKVDPLKSFGGGRKKGK